jgi:anthranilate synthase component 1
MNNEDIAKKINSAIFPGLQGGPLMHVIAGKAAAFHEALQPAFKTYQQQVIKNATVLAETLVERGLRIVSGRTESHVMLVDLARNDIGRVCDYGSVQVKDLMVVERYSHVMHIVSQVNGKLSPNQSAFDLMRTTFPAGTLSGAPKIRAMQLISQLEGTTRGPYGGCVGYFAFNGNSDHCITIRTALVKDGMAYVQAGGGWVNDSTPAAEFDETVNKSKAMRKAVALAESFRAS